VTDRESNRRPVGASSGDSTTHLKRSAVMSGTGIHRLIYRDTCVERGASYAACCSQHNHRSVLDSRERARYSQDACRLTYRNTTRRRREIIGQQNSVIKKKYQREDQYLSIEIQP